MVRAEIGRLNLIIFEDPPSVLVPHLRALGGRVSGRIVSVPDLTYNRQAIDRVVDVSYSDSREPIDGGPLPRETDLMSFQIDAARFLRDSNYPGGLLSLRPGLGKTVTALAAAQSLEKVLVLCPRPLVGVWQTESDQWFGRSLVEDPGAPWAITTLETLPRRPMYSTQMWDLIILDESARIRNRQARRTQNVWALRDRAKLFWALSGFPIVNSAADLWAQLRTIWPKAFSSYWRFVDHFCLVEETPWGRSIVGSKPIDLNEAFRELIFIEPEGLSELVPHYEPEVIEVELSTQQSVLFDSMLRDFIVTLENGALTASTKLTQLLRLQQIVSSVATLGIDSDDSSKVDRLIDLIRDGEYDVPCLIWYHWRETGNLLYRRLRQLVGDEDVSKLDEEDTWETIERFQQGKLKYLIASLNIGQYGLSFVKTKTVIYIDRTFDLEKLVQSLYRPRRLGLQHRPRLVTFTSPGTTDDLVQAASEGKMSVASKLAEPDLLEVLQGMR